MTVGKHLIAIAIGISLISLYKNPTRITQLLMDIIAWSF